MHARLRPLALLLAGAGCGGEHGKAASSGCGEQACPVGTSPTTVESVYAVETASLNLVDVTDGPSRSGEGGVGYAIRSESTCAFACVAIEPCPPGTVSLITDDCFTCAELTEAGIRGGECDYEGTTWTPTGRPAPITRRSPTLPRSRRSPVARRTPRPTAARPPAGSRRATSTAMAAWKPATTTTPTSPSPSSLH